MPREETPPTLAARVKYVRGFVPTLSKRQLSLMAGLSPSMVGMIERGQRMSLESETASGLADVLGVTLDWLLLGRGSNPKVRSTTEHIMRAMAERPERNRGGRPRKEGASS